jgi:hypothetical protein
MDPINAPMSLIDLQRKFRTQVKNFEIPVYSNAWFFRIFESLAEDYQALVWSLGKDVFKTLIHAYLQQYPSNSYTLAHAAHCFPKFLTQWDYPQKQRWHHDLALLECRFVQAFFAEDPKPLNLQGLSDAAQIASLPLRLHPAVWIVQSDWKIDLVWKHQTKSPLQKATYCCVYRNGFDGVMETISERTFQIFNHLSQGISLEDLLDRFPQKKTIQLITKFASIGLIVNGS